jgi:hypothetical protein
VGVLVETNRRLRALRPDHPQSYGVRIGVPEEPGWLPLDAVDVDAWCADARVRDNPRGLASVAATAVGGALTHAVIGRVTAALLLDRRAWHVDAANLAAHPERGEAAVRSPRLLVLPDDPAAGAPDATVVADLAALLDRVAAGAVATLTPLFDAVRAATRYGLAPLWNGLADSVRSAATYVPIYAGGVPGASELADALIEALIANGAWIRARGADVPLRWREREYSIAVRAACCLYFKVADAYCMTCPFLDAGARESRFGAFIDEIELSRARR